MAVGAPQRVGPSFHWLSHPVGSFQSVLSASPTATQVPPTAQDLIEASDVVERFAESFEPGLYSGEDGGPPTDL